VPEKSVHFSVHHIYGTIQDKMTLFLTKMLREVMKLKELGAIFMQLLNILLLTAQHHNTNKMLFPTAQFMYLSPKTSHY